jgi:hypothetical protein
VNDPRDVLVTDVQGVPAPSGGDSAEVVPSGAILITFGVAPKNAAQVVWAAEFGKIYLALEPKDGDHSSAPFIQVKSIFKK